MSGKTLEVIFGPANWFLLVFFMSLKRKVKAAFIGGLVVIICIYFQDYQNEVAFFVFCASINIGQIVFLRIQV